MRAPRRAAGFGWYFVVGWWAVGLFYLAGYLLLLGYVTRRQSGRVFELGLSRALTLGQEPPGARKLAEAAAAAPDDGEQGRFRRLLASIRERWTRSAAAVRYERLTRAEPPPTPGRRVVWFLLVGWWFAGGWTLVAWLAVLPPYPFVGVSRALLRQLPALMFLERPPGSRLPTNLEPLSK